MTYVERAARYPMSEAMEQIAAKHADHWEHGWHNSGEDAAGALALRAAFVAAIREALARVPAPAVSATCRVRAVGKTDPPQDCDWPFCGCDQHADKVIATLQEHGWGPQVHQERARERAAVGIKCECVYQNGRVVDCCAAHWQFVRERKAGFLVEFEATKIKLAAAERDLVLLAEKYKELKADGERLEARGLALAADVAKLR